MINFDDLKSPDSELTEFWVNNTIINCSRKNNHTSKKTRSSKKNPKSKHSDIYSTSNNIKKKQDKN